MDEPMQAGFWFSVVFNTAAITMLCFAVAHLLRSSRSGAPFVPSFGIPHLIGLANIRKGDVVFELGCGDGRFSVAAVKAGASRAVGYDISTILVRLARLRARMSKTADRCEFRTGDIRTCDPSEATLVFLYLMPAITNELASGVLMHLKPGARVLSSCFPIHLETHPGFRLLGSENLGLGSVGYLYERI